MNTEHPLSAIATAAGYADQSHFIRECHRWLGTCPSDYRRSRRSRA